MSLNKIKSGDSLESIISLYDYKLPFVVAEYFCLIYRSNIVCNTNINYKSLFANFIEYKDHIQYIFGNAVDGNKNGYSFIKLTGVEVSIPIGKDSEFMDKYSNIIFSLSADCGLEWYDEEDLPPWLYGFSCSTNHFVALLPNEKIDLDKSKYIGRCKLTF